MNCLHAMAPNDEDLLNYALDGEALPEAARTHLEQCEICQQRLASYQQINTSLITHLYRRLCPTGTNLSLYCAGLIPANEQTRIASHLLDCPLCAAEVVDTRRFIAEVDPVPPSMFSPVAAVRRIVATLVKQQAQLALRDGGNLPEKFWPRQYRAESIDLSLHLSRASNGAYILLGILTSADITESVDAFEGIEAELFAAPYTGEQESTGNGTAKKPLHSTIVDDLGNIVFPAITVGEYVLIVHLPRRDLVVEGLSIE